MVVLCCRGELVVVGEHVGWRFDLLVYFVERFEFDCVERCEPFWIGDEVGVGHFEWFEDPFVEERV